MLKLTFEAAAPREDALGVKEQIAMVLEQLGYRDIQCTEVLVVRPEQMKMENTSSGGFAATFPSRGRQ